MSLLGDRRFDALLAQVDERRESIARDLRGSWAGWGSGWVDDAIQEAFVALPRQQNAIERYAAAQGRRPTVDDLEAKWRVASQSRMKDALRAHQGRAKDGPRVIVSLEVVGERAAEGDPDLAVATERQLFEEALMVLSDQDDRRYARMRILDMNASAKGERTLTMSEAREELGWTQRRWNERGAAVRQRLDQAFERVATPRWCAEHQAALEGWMAAQLDPHTHQRVALHVEGCDTCAAAAMRLQAELREATRRVLDPFLPITLAGGLGLMGWVKAKLGLAAVAATGAPSAGGTAIGGGATAAGSGVIGGALTSSTIVKVCAGVAAAGCVAAVGVPLTSQTKVPKAPPAPNAPPPAAAARPVGAPPAPTLPGNFAKPNLGALPGASVRVPAGRATATSRSSPRSAADDAKPTAARRGSTSASRAFALSSTPSRQPPATAVSDRALGIESAAPSTPSATAPTPSDGGAKSEAPAPTAAQAADQAFTP